MKIIGIFPNGIKDTMARLISDGFDNTKGIDLLRYDYSTRLSEREGTIIEQSKDADYIFVFWCKYQHTYVDRDYTHNLLDTINRPDIVVYVDGSEYNSTGWPSNNQAELSKKDPSLCKGEPWIDEKMYQRCKWYFKRETYEEDLVRDKIVPLLVGGESSYFKAEDIDLDIKKHDIFCSFGHTWTGLRGEVQDICVNLKDEGFNNIIGSSFPYNIYIDNIIQSYISVSSWGAGNSCRRMWEIMSNKTCCFVQKKQILFPNIFEDGVSYVEYSTPKEFEEKARYYLQNKDKCIEIGRNGHIHMKKYHTGKRRLEYMLNVMSGKDWRNAL